MNFTIRPYQKEDKEIWNNFVRSSPNATFLFHRDFMEYHAHRFNDHSLMIFRNEKLFAILPAHIEDNGICSHNGLTYGGIITSKVHGTDAMEAGVDALVKYAKENDFERIVVKVTPSFLQEKYSSAQEYFLFHNGFELTRRDLNFVLDLRNALGIHKSKLKKLQHIDAAGIRIYETKDLLPFWEQVLVPVLRESHDVSPVHSIEEISSLRENFPNNILQYNVEEDGSVVAGMTLFVANGVVKSQYGAATKRGKELRALDLLYVDLFNEYKAKKFRYFDMGTTTVNGGKDFNKGLTRYKEEFGALPVSLDHYKKEL